MNAMDAIFYIAILVMSIVIHEVSHGFMADYFGDKTARYAGRLTLNPLPHLDLFGSVLLPIFLFISTASTGHPFVFGWAKPVPYNPNNLSNKRLGTIAVASAGVLSNFIIAILFGIIIRLSFGFAMPDSFYSITSIIVLVNLALGIFNLIPIPPLDGSKILFSLLPYSFNKVIRFLEQYGFIFLLVLIFFLSNSSSQSPDPLSLAMSYLFNFLTGLAL